MFENSKYVFFDLETSSECDLKVRGSYRYVDDPSTHIVCASFFDHTGAGGVWAPERYRRAGDGLTDEWLDAFRDHVSRGGICVAWNAAFDRLVVQRADPIVPLKLRQVVCAQAQAEAFNLPGKLEKAAEALRVIKKDPRGKRLISKMVRKGVGSFTDDEWAAFLSYVETDSRAGLAVFQRTRPLTAEEWLDYWLLQEKNDRGIAIDLGFAQAAVEWADEELTAINRQLVRLTGVAGMTVQHHKKKAEYLESLLEGTFLHESMFLATQRKGKKVTSKSSGSAVRDEIRLRIEQASVDELVDGGIDPARKKQILAYFDLLDAGSGVATKKYAKMCDTHVRGLVHGQFAFNGAGQTGREASRGVQFQNVIRAALPGWPHPALDVMDCICDVGPYAQMSREHRVRKLEEWYGLPFQDILSRCIRPTIIAPPGKMLVWADWSSVEARILPWLANSRPAEKKLDLFRTNVDPYKVNAARTFGVEYDAVTKAQRQIGKVQELALGYGGGVGAFQSMAKNYGVRVADEVADGYKDAWRRANPWAKPFWDALNEAATNAMYQAGHWFSAGRVAYLFSKGTLHCRLPDNRLITYPQAKVEEVYKEKWDAVVRSITYRKVFGLSCLRGELYGGFLAENVTQATAASLLRWALRRLDEEGIEVVATIHDEIICEVDEARAEEVKAVLQRVMTTNPEWAEGLPIEADGTSGRYFSK